MPLIFRTLLLVALLASVGCGQKGPLRLPEERASTPAAASVAPSQEAARAS